MKHSLKSQILQLLAKFPDALGNFIYHSLQKRSEGSNVGTKITTVSRSFEVICKILQDNNINLQDKNVLEVGSGWAPILPYLMILKANVRSVKTFDINEHYSKNQIQEVNRFYANHEGFSIVNDGKYKLLEKVEYYPKQNVLTVDLEDIDFIFSRFVLEHIPRNVMTEMHSQFAKKLKKDSYILHLISPSDHRAYTDSTLSLQDFLKYSQSEWDSIQTRFDYHNRLRLPQYLDIFRKDFEIISLEYNKTNVESSAYKKFKRLKIHPDFEHFSDQELMAGSINILLRKR